jgi:hypothetical protein
MYVDGITPTTFCPCWCRGIYIYIHYQGVYDLVNIISRAHILFSHEALISIDRTDDNELPM